MTDKYTIEEIKTAIHDEYIQNGFGGSTNFPEKVIKRLTKPEYEFREGEVIYRQGVGYVQIHHWNVQDGRKLRLSEMPKAVEDLREAANMCECSHTVAHAIAAFDKEVER